MTPEIADAIVGITLTRGGGTFDRRGALIELETGYAVGIYRGTWAKLAPSESELAYGVFKSLLTKFGAVYIGTWYHQGEIWVDPVLITESRDFAEEMGRIHGQKAIYSFENGEIFL